MSEADCPQCRMPLAFMGGTWCCLYKMCQPEYREPGWFLVEWDGGAAIMRNDPDLFK